MAMATTLMSTEQVVSEQLCVVFDAATGDLVHVHEIISLAGGRQPSKAEAAAETLSLTRQVAEERRLPIPPMSQLEVLHATPGTMEAGVAYRVDLATRQLVRATEAARAPAGHDGA